MLVFLYGHCAFLAAGPSVRGFRAPEIVRKQKIRRASPPPVTPHRGVANDYSQGSYPSFARRLTNSGFDCPAGWHPPKTEVLLLGIKRKTQNMHA
jgi:hypothetical protein